MSGAPVPHSKTELQSFLALTSNFRRIIKGLAKTTGPLHAATSTKRNFAWNDQMDITCTDLKKRLQEPPILAYRKLEYRFVV